LRASPHRFFTGGSRPHGIFFIAPLQTQPRTFMIRSCVFFCGFFLVSLLTNCSF